MLQKSLVFLGQPVIVDHDAGPKTRAACANVDEALLVEIFMKEREDKYRSIVANDPSQSMFLQGWLNRLKKVNDTT
jgi:hypothetical protein